MYSLPLLQRDAEAGNYGFGSGILVGKPTIGQVEQGDASAIPLLELIVEFKPTTEFKCLAQIHFKAVIETTYPEAWR